MAKKTRQRDASPIARPQPQNQTRPAGRSPSVNVTPSTVDLRLISDRRTFHPEQTNAPVLKLGGQPARLEVRNRPARNRTQWQKDKFGDTLRSQTKGAIAFAEPSLVTLCIRSKRRKETLFALKKTGKGARTKKRFNWTSKIGC